MSDPNAPGSPTGEPANPYGQPSQPDQPPQYGQAPQYGQPPQYGQAPQYGQPGYYSEAVPPDPDADKRPSSVTAACVITLLLSGLTAVLTVIGLIALAADKDQILDEVRNEPQLEDVNADDVYAALIIVLVVVVVWCLVAMLLAILALRRSNTARILLVISSAMTALTSLLLILSAVSAVTLICGVAVMVMLLTGGARDWYARKNAPPQMPMGTTQPWG